MLVTDTKGRVLTDVHGVPMTTKDRWHPKLQKYLTAVTKSQGNLSSILPYAEMINQKLWESNGNLMFLTYKNATSLNLRIQTESVSNWEVDWDGSGDWQSWNSSATNRTKTFTSPTSGVVFIRSSVGNPIEDIYSVYTTTGTWNFDISALETISYYVWLVDDMGVMNLSGNIKAFSNVTRTININGSNMKLFGSLSDLSNLTYWLQLNGNQIDVSGNSSDIAGVLFRVQLIGNMLNIIVDLSDFSSVENFVFLAGDLIDVTGDLSVLKNVVQRIQIESNNANVIYTSTTWSTLPTAYLWLRLSSGKLTQSEVDQLFIDLNNAGTTGIATIDLRGSNAAPSSASSSARTALASRGYTILHN